MQGAKNKSVTYLLIAAVAVVWGIIVYRIFFMEPPEDQGTFLKSTAPHEPFDQYEVSNDTFTLALNYRDPFLGKAGIPAEAPKTGQAAGGSPQVPVKPVPPPINWGAISYSGYLANPRTKRLVSILTVNGKERMVAEGESLEGVKLLKNRKDSVLVSWMGKQKYIKQ